MRTNKLTTETPSREDRLVEEVEERVHQPVKLKAEKVVSVSAATTSRDLFASRGEGCRGSAVLIVVSLLALIVAAVVGSLLALSANDARLAAIEIDTQKAVIAAEAGLEYGVQKLRDIVLQYRLSPYITSNELQALVEAIPPPTPIPPYIYRSPSGRTSFRIRIETPVVSGVITNGRACFGSDGADQVFSITCGAMNPGTGAGAVLKQTVHAVRANRANSPPGAAPIFGVEEVLWARTGWAEEGM